MDKPIIMSSAQTRRYRVWNACGYACSGIAAVFFLFTVAFFAGVGFQFAGALVYPTGIAGTAASVSLIYFIAAESIVVKLRKDAVPKPVLPDPIEVADTVSDVKLSSVGLSDGVRKAMSVRENGPDRPVSDNPTTGRLTSAPTESEVKA